LARRLSWSAVADAFRATWDHVFNSMEMAVSWGRAHQDLWGIEEIGVDEIAWQRGHKYLTRAAGGCCGSARNGRPKRCCDSSAGWAKTEPASCVLYAGICGNHI